MGLCSQQKEEEPKRSLAGLKLDAGMEDLSVGNIYVWGQWSSCTRSCGSGEWRNKQLGLIPGYLSRKTGTDSVYHADSEDTDILVEFTGNSIMKFLTNAILTPSKSKFWTVFRSQNSTYKY